MTCGIDYVLSQPCWKTFQCVCGVDDVPIILGHFQVDFCPTFQIGAKCFTYENDLQLQN